MDIECSKILILKSVDKREIPLQLPNMEKEAVSQVISYLQAKNVTIEKITIDASSAVRKMLCKLHMCKVFTYIHTTYVHTLPNMYIHMYTVYTRYRCVHFHFVKYI